MTESLSPAHAHAHTHNTTDIDVTLSHLIDERELVKKTIADLCTEHNYPVIQMGLLQRKLLNITSEIEAKCSPHQWGEEYWGYIPCKVCGYLRSTKHA